MGLNLSLLPSPLMVCQLAADAALPSWLPATGFRALTWTDDELSIVCESTTTPQGVRVEGPWRALKIQGPLAFGLTGILHQITDPLAKAQISLFAMSTFDTDYVLVKTETLDAVLDVLSAAGHRIEE